MDECQDSCTNILKKKISELNVNLRDQSDVNKLKGEENISRELVKLGEVCGVSVANKELAVEVTRLKIEKINLKAEIQTIKAVKDKEVKTQRQGFLNMTKLEDEN